MQIELQQRIRNLVLVFSHGNVGLILVGIPNIFGYGAKFAICIHPNCCCDGRRSSRLCAFWVYPNRQERVWVTLFRWSNWDLVFQDRPTIQWHRGPDLHLALSNSLYLSIEFGVTYTREAVFLMFLGYAKERLGEGQYFLLLLVLRDLWYFIWKMVHPQRLCQNIQIILINSVARRAPVFRADCGYSTRLRFWIKTATREGNIDKCSSLWARSKALCCPALVLTQPRKLALWPARSGVLHIVLLALFVSTEHQWVER